jgi:hypothetical protein
MTFEIVLLALVNAIRPTSLAAVYALLSAKAPRRLMTVYVTSGLVFTTAFGLLVIWAFRGVNVHHHTGRALAIAEIIFGVIAVLFALAVLAGRGGGKHADDVPDIGTANRWAELLERRLTFRTALVAGPVTHIPGLFYLLALNVVVANHPSSVVGLVEVLIYNVIWFAIPILALVVCVFNPDIARKAVGVIQSEARKRSRAIVLAVSFGVGVALIIRGALAL